MDIMELDVTNFNDFTPDEYCDNLLRLGAVSHSSLVGTKCYFVKKVYGIHKIIKWDADKAEFLLSLDGQRFWTNPFLIHICD